MKLAALALAIVANTCIVSAVDSIPYDSTLVLGNIIDTDRITDLQATATLQRKVDVAENKYSASLQNKLSLDMDLQETVRLGVFGDGETAPAEDAEYKLMERAVTAANDAVKTSLLAKVNAKAQYQVELMKQLTAKAENDEQTTFGTEPDSPIKWSSSKMEYLDLSSDTMNMNVQFFQNEQNAQGSKSHTQKIASFVQATVGVIFGGSAGSSASKSASRNIAQQTENHQIESTLVIAVTATHKKAQQFTDIKWDADKLVAAWNAKKKDEPLSVQGPGIEAMYKELMAADDSGGSTKKSNLQILSGRTFGSSFIGFVHFVKTTESTNFQDMQTSAVAAQSQATYGGFFAKVTGKFGMDSQYSNDIKSLLSTTKLQSHVSVITMGIIPSIASQEMKSAVKQFTQFSPDELEGKLNVLTNGNQAEARGGMDMESGAADSIRAGQINGAQKGTIEAVLSGVSNTVETKNQVMDTNSLMHALDDYVEIARDMEGGVPVNFYISNLDKKTVISEWFKEYRPDLLACSIHGAASPQCMKGASDDVETPDVSTASFARSAPASAVEPPVTSL